MKLSVHVINFSVEGSGDFPFDMLRYDACWPVDSESAHQLYGVHHEHRIVHLRQHADRAKGAVTIERWRSQGWSVRREPSTQELLP